MTNFDIRIVKAKQIYFKYAGSGYQMCREGVLEEYQQYSISKEQETEWLNELLKKEFERLDINDFNPAFPFWFIVECHSSFPYFDKFLNFLESKNNESTNSYYLLRYAETAFSLLEQLSKSTNELSRDLKIKCINNTEILKDKVKTMELPDKFNIPEFSVIGVGLTQQQYVLRKIADLERKLFVVRILK